MCPLFVSAIVMTQAKCPQHFVQSKSCNFIKPTEITKLATEPYLTDMVAAEKLMKECLEIADKSLIDMGKVMPLKATVLIRLVRYVMAKQGSPSFDRMEQICSVFMDSINELIDDKFENPWASSETNNKGKAKTSTIVEYNEDGSAARA